MVPVREKFGKKKVLEPVPEKFGPGKSTSIGTGTIWHWYRKIPGNLVPVSENSREFSSFWVVPILVPEQIGPEKVLVPVTETFGPGKR